MTGRQLSGDVVSFLSGQRIQAELIARGVPADAAAVEARAVQAGIQTTCARHAHHLHETPGSAGLARFFWHVGEGLPAGMHGPRWNVNVNGVGLHEVPHEIRLMLRREELLEEPV